MFRLVRTLAALGLALALAGCPADETLECVVVDPTCTPLYAPTWPNVFANTFAPKCGVGGSSCHAGSAPSGGLHLDDPARAHADLTDPGRGFVIPADPSCSEVVERMRASSSRLVMPRGSRLAEAEICAIEQWIAAGAPGPADAGVGATVDSP